MGVWDSSADLLNVLRGGSHPLGHFQGAAMVTLFHVVSFRLIHEQWQEIPSIFFCLSTARLWAQQPKQRSPRPPPPPALFFIFCIFRLYFSAVTVYMRVFPELSPCIELFLAS